MGRELRILRQGRRIEIREHAVIVRRRSRAMSASRSLLQRAAAASVGLCHLGQLSKLLQQIPQLAAFRAGAGRYRHRLGLVARVVPWSFGGIDLERAPESLR